MSVETMLAFSRRLDLPLDFLMFGKLSEQDKKTQSEEDAALLHILSQCPPAQKKYALRLLKLFLASMNHLPIE